MWTLIALVGALFGPRQQKDSLVRALVIDDVRIRLDSTTTLLAMQAVFGKTRLHAAQNHDDVAWACYKLPLDSGSVYLQLKSDDMGGPSHDIMGFQLGRTPPTGVEIAACSPTHRVRSVATDNQLFIGMAIGDLLSIMHTPTEHRDGRYKFEYSQQVTEPGVAPYDIGGTLIVETANGRVTRLDASYAATR